MYVGSLQIPQPDALEFADIPGDIYVFIRREAVYCLKRRSAEFDSRNHVYRHAFIFVSDNGTEGQRDNINGSASCVRPWVTRADTRKDSRVYFVLGAAPSS